MEPRAAQIIIPARSTPTSNLMGLSEEAKVWSPAIFQIITSHNRDFIVWDSAARNLGEAHGGEVNAAQTYIHPAHCIFESLSNDQNTHK